MQEQIFISYRRDGGDVTAKLICEALKNRGYTVFYDYDSLSGGYFDDRIFAAIEGCGDFILVLPEHSLDRCVNEDDWVRQEIAHALKLGKNIVPVMLPGFKFPSVLPTDIENVSRVNGVQFVMNYFEGVMGAIVDRLTEIPHKAPQDTPPSDYDAAGERKPFLIRNVCSFGSCDFNSITPKDAFYSETIDRTKYNIVYFSVSTINIRDKSEITSKATIYDEKNHVVFEDISKIPWKNQNNKVVIRWVIRDKDGSFVKAGKYRAVFQIENSLEYEYEFTITVNNGREVGPEDERKKIWVQRFLNCPRVFVAYALMFFSFMLFVTFIEMNFDAVTIILLALTLFLWVNMLLKTRKYIFKHIFPLLLVTTIGILYYGLFLTIMAVSNIFMRRTWKKMLRG